jgi:hypothetical protein
MFRFLPAVCFALSGLRFMQCLVTRGGASSAERTMLCPGLIYFGLAGRVGFRFFVLLWFGFQAGKIICAAKC